MFLPHLVQKYPPRCNPSPFPSSNTSFWQFLTLFLSGLSTTICPTEMFLENLLSASTIDKKKLVHGILTIREANTDRDRYIPLSDSVKEACISYTDKIWWEKDSDFFFLAPDKTMISPMTVYQRYRRYLEVAGISHDGKGQGPRLHDIRHTFAVHVLQTSTSLCLEYMKFWLYLVVCEYPYK